VLTIKKIDAAISQLEAAILLWFHEASPVAIHGLAAAAHDCFQSISKHPNKPPFFQTWLGSLPKSAQVRERNFQKFIKHGFKDLKGKVSFSPKHGEALMWGSLWCYEDLFAMRSPLLALFHARFLIENPQFY
jgi:hypothetical protein